ncbi:MAG: tRNA (N(6)-L-threonylcarbamoyladenosine(37)-C(2))-methylthiotransferase MtaB, partial [Candidatus Omnitrophica bacterium]|nr:tRNA (N(6)-L-threonylcarbamoyladenosine(37)-C(2))-methylthiotransferase MtaB [Candidatus Omnitrophota bacterium]
MSCFKIYTLGCKVNQYETQLMREQLHSVGLKEASPHNPADLCIINTCTVT